MQSSLFTVLILLFTVSPSDDINVISVYAWHTGLGCLNSPGVSLPLPATNILSTLKTVLKSVGKQRSGHKISLSYSSTEREVFCWLPCNRLQYQNVSTQSVAGLVFNHWLAWSVRWWNLCPRFKLVLVWLLSCALSLRYVPWRRHVQHATGTSTQSKLHSLTERALPFMAQINLDSHWVSFASYTQPSNLFAALLSPMLSCSKSTFVKMRQKPPWARCDEDWSKQKVKNKLNSSVFSLIITILACQNQVH